MSEGRASAAPPPPAEVSTQDLLLRGVRVRYVEAGAGDVLLLVHGMFTSARVWQRVIPRLAQHYRVIAPDLPGFGGSEKPTRYAFTREAYAETLCDLLAGVGVPRAHVVGHDMGGAVALTLAADHPEVIDRLAVINTLPARGPLPAHARLALVPVVGSFVLKQFYTRAAFRGYFRDDVYAPDAAWDRDAVDGWFDAFDPPEARECALRALRGAAEVSALGPRIARVRAPTLVLWGERDRHGPVHMGRRLAYEIPGARFEPIARAAHSPHEEHPDATVDALLRHLRGAPRR